MLSKPIDKHILMLSYNIILLNIVSNYGIRNYILLYYTRPYIIMDRIPGISNFLKSKLVEHKLTLRELAFKSNIKYITISHIKQGLKANPSIHTILQIANFFECSIDEVIGRDSKYFITKPPKYNFNVLKLEEINENLKSFILTKLNQLEISPSRLSVKLGFNNELLSNFISKNPNVKTLSSKAILALADYFDLSIDEMIGRVSYNTKGLSKEPINNN